MNRFHQSATLTYLPAIAWMNGVACVEEVGR